MELPFLCAGREFKLDVIPKDARQQCADDFAGSGPEQKESNQKLQQKWKQTILVESF